MQRVQLFAAGVLAVMPSAAACSVPAAATPAFGPVADADRSVVAAAAAEASPARASAELLAGSGFDLFAVLQ